MLSPGIGESGDVHQAVMKSLYEDMKNYYTDSAWPVSFSKQRGCSVEAVPGTVLIWASSGHLQRLSV